MESDAPPQRSTRDALFDLNRELPFPRHGPSSASTSTSAPAPVRGPRPPNPRQLNAPSRSVLLKRRVLELEDYARELRNGGIAKDDRVRLFGSMVVPVPVALARGETTAENEARFLEWLRGRNLRLADIKHDANKERCLRISFAKHNAEALAKQVRGAKRERAEPAPEPELVPSNPTLPAAQASTTSTTASMVTEQHDTDDPVESQLLDDYNEFNERVLANERVLETSAAKLRSGPMDEIMEATRRQDENQELRAFIHEESENRSAALAILLVYLWRNAQAELEQRVNTPSAMDVPHVQQVCHRKCATLSTDLARQRAQAAALKQQLDALLANNRAPAGSETAHLDEIQRVATQLTTVEQQARESFAARRREFATLIHFDEHVRHLIRTLLTEP